VGESDKNLTQNASGTLIHQGGLMVFRVDSNTEGKKKY
jgi:hypothetical protein